MARFTPTAAVTETSDWEGGDYVYFDKLRDQVMQNLEYLLQNHDHNGNLGDGATIPTVDPKSQWFYASGGSPIP